MANHHADGPPLDLGKSSSGAATDLYSASPNSQRQRNPYLFPVRDSSSQSHATRASNSTFQNSPPRASKVVGVIELGDDEDEHPVAALPSPVRQPPPPPPPVLRPRVRRTVVRIPLPRTREPESTDSADRSPQPVSPPAYPARQHLAPTQVDPVALTSSVPTTPFIQPVSPDHGTKRPAGFPTTPNPLRRLSPPAKRAKPDSAPFPSPPISDVLFEFPVHQRYLDYDKSLATQEVAGNATQPRYPADIPAKPSNPLANTEIDDNSGSDTEYSGSDTEDESFHQENLYQANQGAGNLADVRPTVPSLETNISNTSAGPTSPDREVATERSHSQAADHTYIKTEPDDREVAVERNGNDHVYIKTEPGVREFTNTPRIKIEDSDRNAYYNDNTGAQNEIYPMVVPDRSSAVPQPIEEANNGPPQRVVPMNSAAMIEQMVSNIIDNDEDVPEDVGRQDLLASSLRDHQKIGLKWLLGKEESVNKGGVLADDMGLGKTLEIISLVMSNQSSDPNCKTTLVIAPLAVLEQWIEEFKKHVLPEHRLKVAKYHSKTRGRYRTFEELAENDVVVTTYGIISAEYKNQFRFDEDITPESIPINHTSLFFQQKSKFFRVVLDEAHGIQNFKTLNGMSCTKLQAEYRWCLSGTPMQNSVGDLYSYLNFLRFPTYSDRDYFYAQIARPLSALEPVEVKDAFQMEAMKRLRVLIKAVMLRRTKTSKINGHPILTLPVKIVQDISWDFGQDEREYYDKLEKGYINQIQQLMKDGSAGFKMASVFVLLTRLRQASCHLKIVEKAYLMKNDLFIESWLNRDAVRLARRLYSSAIRRISSIPHFKCPLCHEVSDSENFILTSPCGHYLCTQCCIGQFQIYREGGPRNCKCPDPTCNSVIVQDGLFSYVVFKWIHIEKLGDRDIIKRRKMYDIIRENETSLVPEVQPVEQEAEEPDPSGSELFTDIGHPPSLPPSDLSPNSKFARKGGPVGRDIIIHPDWKPVFPRGWVTSTKVHECFNIIKHIVTTTDEKIIVFAGYLGTLVCLELEISLYNKYDCAEDRGSRISCRRYDGLTKCDERTALVQRFQRRKHPRVLLISIKSGNAGLNLTAASRVIIMDPNWNPFVEEQAMDRAYRYGQMRPVYVYRFYIKHSIEDRIVALQKRKKQMIDAALDETEIGRLSNLDQREFLLLFGLNERGERIDF